MDSTRRAEDHPPLVVDPDRVESLAIVVEGFETVPDCPPVQTLLRSSPCLAAAIRPVAPHNPLQDADSSELRQRVLGELLLESVQCDRVWVRGVQIAWVVVPRSR